MLGYPKKSVALSIIFFLSALGVIFFILKVPLKIGEYRGYSIKIISPTAEGIGIGGPISISGVQIGKISKIELSPDGKKVIITAEIKSGVKIARDSKVEMKMKGILGDRIISFKQGEKLDDPLKDGDIVFIPEKESEIAQITTSIETTAQKFAETLDSVKELTEKIGKLVENLNETALGIRSQKIWEDIKSSTTKLGDTISEANRMFQNTNQLISDIRSIINKIEPAISEFSKDATQTSENIKSASENLKLILEKAQRDGIIEVVAGKESHKIQKIINDIDNLSSKVNNIAQKTEDLTSRIKSEVGAKLEGGIQEKSVFSQQIQAKIKKDDSFVEIGITSPPGEDKVLLNTTIGKSLSSKVDIGIGFIRSKPSLLAEIKPVGGIFIRTEGIGFNTPNIRALIGWRYKIIGIYGGSENILYKNRFFLLGMEVKS